MHLFLLGLSHHTAPVEIRERVDFSRQGIERALDALAGRAVCGEAVVLSTCNRSEIYAACDDSGRARQDLTAFLAGFHDVPADLLEPYLYALVDADAARHLFRVAAGLDSLVVGEPQILGQVKEAYAAAAERHFTGPLLNKLFHAAFAAGKHVRSETGLAEGAVSVSYAAVSLARKIFGDLSRVTALLVGAGEMAKLAARHLKTQRVRQLAIASRRPEQADALAARLDGAPVAWADLDEALAGSDIVISATGATMPIFTRARVAAAMLARRNRPLFVIDIAVPRDVEPAAGEIEQVFLYNIDDLQAIVSDNLGRRSSEIERAEAIVGEEVARYLAWLHSRDAIPTVVALRQRFEAIRLAELKRLEPKLASMPPEVRARVDEITHLIIEKLLLTPTEQLKAMTDQQTVAAYADALSHLFSLTGDEDDEGSDLEFRPGVGREGRNSRSDPTKPRVS